MLCFGVFWFFFFGHAFFLSPNFLQESSGIDYLSIHKVAVFPLSLSRFYFLVNWPPAEEALLDWCWKQRFCLISEWLMENCQGKGACCLHISPWKASPKRGYPVDWIFSQWLCLNIQLLSWHSLPWNKLFCLTSYCPVKLHFIFLYRNYPILCFSP